MTTPAQMFDHELNPVKGWPGPAALDKTKAIGPGESIQRGRVMSIGPNDTLILGAYFNAMPIFAFPSTDDFDVASDVGNFSGGHGMGLVATGHFEVETTEFMTSFEELRFTYPPNTPVAPWLYSANDVGKIFPTGFTLFDRIFDQICGIVSDASPLTNEFQKQVVRFWTTYIPYIDIGEWKSKDKLLPPGKRSEAEVRKLAAAWRARGKAK